MKTLRVTSKQASSKAWLVLLSAITTLHFQPQANAQESGLDESSGRQAKVTIGAYYFDGWSGRSRWADDPDQPWAKAAPTHLTRRMIEEFSDREPLWGWRDDSPEIMQQQIELAADHGVEFFAFCWYWHDNAKAINKQGIQQDPKHTGLELYLKAPNNRRLKFCLLVAKIVGELPKFEVRNEQVLCIRGRSDFADHPVYQTKWAMYGLRALGLDDPYTIPTICDSYSSLFWMDYRASHVHGAEARDRARYPYLSWATDHFQGTKLSEISNRDYPLTWEIRASQADYPRMAIVDLVCVQQKIATPRTWHAAEVFLYLHRGSGQ